MKKKSLSTGGAKIFVYVFLILLAVICLFPFYILIINAARAHADIQKGLRHDALAVPLPEEVVTSENGSFG